MIRRSIIVFLNAGLCLAALLPLPGCGSGNAGKLAPVRGQVLYKGAPLSRGFIAFTPDALRGTAGPVAYAEIQPDGSFDLRTDEGPGAVPGWHRVTVVAVDSPKASPNQRFATVGSLVPEKYRDPELSGLVCEVRAGQANAINFHLE